MKRTCAVALLALLIPVASARHALACSYASDALFPSLYERVKEADAIAWVDAVSIETPQAPAATPGVFGPFYVVSAISMSELTVQAVETIKGNFAGGVLRVLAGSVCSSYDYSTAVGRRLLVLLDEGSDGTWSVSEPLATNDGRLSSADGSREAVVRQYARIDQLDDYELEKLELRQLQRAARRERLPYPDGLDTEIDEHFNTPYPTKSYEDLLELYTKGEIDTRRRVLWAFAKGRHEAARPLMQSLLRSPDFSDFAEPIVAYLHAMPDDSSVQTLGEAHLAMNRKARAPIMWALLDRARDQDSALMLSVLESADADEADRLSGWFVRHPSANATALLRTLAGSRFGDKQELALSLAALGDEAVVDYARDTIAATHDVDRTVRLAFLASPAERDVRALAEKRANALRVLTRSPLPQADALTREVMSEGNLKDAHDVAWGLLDSADPSRWQRLRAIPNLRAVDEASGHSVRRSIEDLAKDGDPDANALLDLLE